jgi:hypothetical protein
MAKKNLTIAENNQYPLHLITRLKAHTQRKQLEPKTKEKGKKWATFTHHSAKVRTITYLFKDTDINIAYKTTKTIQQRTKTQNSDTTLTNAASTKLHVKLATSHT